MSAPVFPFPPNWESEVSETEDYLTDIPTAWTGKEQRFSLRAVPGRSLEFDAVVWDVAEMATLQNLLARYQRSIWAVPWWPDASMLTADLSAGGLVVLVGTTARLYEAGKQAMLWNGAGEYEVLDIDTVSAGGLLVEEEILSEWPAGSVVVPLVPGRIISDFEIDQLSDRMASFRVHFDCREEL